MQLLDATVGIVTVLPEEFLAVRGVFGCNDYPVSSGAGRKYSYSLARIESTTHGGYHVVAVIQLPDMGTNHAAAGAAVMLEHCPQMQYVIMVGIAGAVPHPDDPKQHVRLGDIVVCDRVGVIQADFVKEELGRLIVRSPPRPPSAVLLEAARRLESGPPRHGRDLWGSTIEKFVNDHGKKWLRPPPDVDILRDSPDREAVSHPQDPDRMEGHPRVFHGPIASGNTLLKNPVKRDQWRHSHGVKAIEMEAAGVADAVWRANRNYFVVRGTCDYCNPGKNDTWHNYASLIAAAYARALLESTQPCAPIPIAVEAPSRYRPMMSAVIATVILAFVSTATAICLIMVLLVYGRVDVRPVWLIVGAVVATWALVFMLVLHSSERIYKAMLDTAPPGVRRFIERLD